MTEPLYPCQTIDEVIDRLERVIERCAVERNQLGYFATMYRDVTVRVRDWIAEGRFDDGPRMERLDVVFANRYLEALDRFLAGETPTRSWLVVFQAANTRPPVILQHLLLGMNAHINLDLAIAAVQTAPGDQLPGLKRDFELINALLDEMIDDVQERIDQISPWMRIIDHVGGRTEEEICAFAIGEARDLAWRAAQHLAVVSPEEFEREVAEHDAIVAALGKLIHSPGPLLRLGLWAVRVRETRPVDEVIAALKM